MRQSGSVIKKLLLSLFLNLILNLPGFSQPLRSEASLSLNGTWEMGFSRKYAGTVIVPSIATDPTQMSNDSLWYRKEIKLPKGNWMSATLELKGARFMPQLYINGKFIAKKNGGMAPVFFNIRNESLKPGKIVVLEIALAPLKNVPSSDASFIPWADHWRSNVSSGLWDDVVLHMHGDVSINRIIPFVNYTNKKASIKFDLNSADHFKGKASVQILDKNGKVLINNSKLVSGSHNAIDFNFNGKLKSWSPDTPTLYKLKLTVSNLKGEITDRSIMSFAVKNFNIKNKQFYLNTKHIVPRGPTVVWHRWMRTKEGRELGYDTVWFKKNIVMRTKNLGGNYLRYHLGLPPERFLDMCDKEDLLVQYEWSFFHGMPASKESLLEQYKNWLDLAMRHPSVSLIHPYNETGGEELKTAWAALDSLLPSYPHLILEDRDVIHIHKYWWSLFENVGLFYDDAKVFPKTIMADEFGGNYLDENGDPGLYSTVKETYLRFLGRTHTKAERLAFHAQSNSKIAEYWRRIGAAGFSPFCALGSNQDGNTWFLGPLKQGNPKPVWAELSAAFSPQAASIEIWDRNFVPGQTLSLPVYVFNDKEIPANLTTRLTIENGEGKVFYNRSFTLNVNAFSKKIEEIRVTMPFQTGNYIIKAELLNRPKNVTQRVISKWDFRILKAKIPENLKFLKVAVASNEEELKAFLKINNITVVNLNDSTANIILTSLKTWNAIADGDASVSQTLLNAIRTEKSVVMLDVGDRPLGQGYPDKPTDFGPLQGVMQVRNPKVNTYNLFGGISLKFTETAEPESHLHPDKLNRELWGSMPNNYTWLWNGLRGGLVVPASDMNFIGLSSKAFIAQWTSRGAIEAQILSGSYYAYELQGFYEFSDKNNDKEVEKKLKDKVNFLVQDAPALASSINPNSPVIVTDLAQGHKDSENGIADNFIPLANCAKNLTQTPVALVDFGGGKGKLIVSQLLTSGRLAKNYGQTGLYGIRYDEVATQLVLNMLSLTSK